MEDEARTREQLLRELNILRNRIALLERSEDDARRQDESLFGTSEQYIRAVVENITEVVFWMARADVSEIFYLSPNYETIWGRSCQSVYDSPRSWMDAIHPMDSERVRRAVLKLNKITHDFEYRIVRPDGTVRWIRDRGFPVRETDGQYKKIVGIAEDITEQKRMEEALRESEEKYRRVFEVENDALLLADEETGTILDVNSAVCALYGYGRDELKNMTIVDLSAEREKSDCAVKGRSVRVPLRSHKKKNGVIFPVDVSMSFFMLQGRQVILAAMRDVTARKAVEEELRQHRRRLETLVRERTSELEMKSKTVEELNIALKVLLHQVQEDKESVEQRFVANVNALVVPYLEKLQKGRADQKQQSYFDIIKANLNEIMSPFLHNVQQLNLTPRETQAANLIRDGKTTKEIAEVLGIAPEAVNSYRNSIRVKLGLTGKKINLQSYLQSLG